MQTMYPGMPFSPSAKLANTIGEADTVIVIDNGAALPDAPNYATIGMDETGEVILYNVKAGNTLSGCVRGVEGTAQMWNAETPIARYWTNRDYSTLIDNITELDGIAAEHSSALERNLAAIESNAAKLATNTAQLSTLSRPNLIDNWYFAADSVIDQRGGYVVSPGATYYTTTALTTSAGTVSAYTKATYTNTTYGSIVVGSTTYYVAYSAMVRGYTGTPAYSIDRWYRRNTANAGHSTLLLESDGIKFFYDESINALHQPIENKSALAGKTITLSVLVKEFAITGGYPRLAIAFADSIGSASYSAIENQIDITGNGLFTITGTIKTDAELLSKPYLSVVVGSAGAEVTGSLKFISAKLELGDTQTHARQDENGNWVLIDPPPNPQQELAKGQRYQVAISGNRSKWVRTGKVTPNAMYFDIDLPTPLRALPAIIKTSGNSVMGIEQVTGSEVSGFTFDAGYRPGETSVRISAVKTSHGLTDGTLELLDVLLDANL